MQVEPSLRSFSPVHLPDAGAVSHVRNFWGSCMDWEGLPFAVQGLDSVSSAGRRYRLVKFKQHKFTRSPHFGRCCFGLIL